MENDNIKSIIIKSGGLLDDAYLAGLVYTREEEKDVKNSLLRDLEEN